MRQLSNNNIASLFKHYLETDYNAAFAGFKHSQCVVYLCHYISKMLIFCFFIFVSVMQQ